jgi:colanic acid/amylovoran biosynthesis glycosyltransferase
MPKKIALIASHINPTMQYHLLSWYNDLKVDGFEFKLFIGSKNKEIPQATNYKINTKRDKLFYLLKNIFRAKKIPKNLQKIQPLMDYNPDIIHLLTSNTFLNIQPLLKYKKIPIIISFRGYDVNVFPFKNENNLKLTKTIFEKADILHFISNGLQENAIKIGAARDKCIIIHRSVNTTLELDINRNDSIPVKIVTVGRLVWEKGYEYALKTLAIIAEEKLDFKYIIAGDGPEMQNLKSLVKEYGLEKKVEFLGKISRKDVERLLLNSDIYFQTSETEALSNAIIEASYFKLPVVASNVGGIPDVVVDGKTGFLSEIGNIKMFSENLVKLINDKNLRYEMGEAGHQNVKSKFSRENELLKWKHHYNTLKK